MGRHTYDDYLLYVSLLESGRSVSHVSSRYGINKLILQRLWHDYRREGPSGLRRKRNKVFNAEEKLRAVLDITEDGLSLFEVMLKHDVSENALRTWRRQYESGGETALSPSRGARTGKTMGRPKKKTFEQMSEMERLQWRVKELEAENALLKKVKALVEEREARLKEIGRKPSRD